jgi:hypothetical protein
VQKVPTYGIFKHRTFLFCAAFETPPFFRTIETALIMRKGEFQQDKDTTLSLFFVVG